MSSGPPCRTASMAQRCCSRDIAKTLLRLTPACRPHRWDIVAVNRALRAFCPAGLPQGTATRTPRSNRPARSSRAGSGPAAVGLPLPSRSQIRTFSQSRRPGRNDRPGLLPWITHWGGRWDLNPRHPGPQPGALPTELRPPRPRCNHGTVSIQVFAQSAEPDSARSRGPSATVPATLAAISRAVAVSGPGMGTKTASR